MKKQHKFICIVSVVLTLIFSILSPYFGLAEESGQATQQQQDEGSQDTESAPTEPADTKEATTTLTDTNNSNQAADTNLTIKPNNAMYPITATTKVAENSLYTLYLDPKTANIRIVNKQTNKEWLGSPQVSRRTPPNNKKFIDSPVHIKYTGGADIAQTYTLKKDVETKLTIQNIDQGVRAQFDLTALKISFAVEYRLRDDGLELTVPYSSIKEDGASRLVSLEVLPFFHAGNETDEGAVFLPDGSGALMIFRENHPKYFSGYSEPVFGSDLTFKAESFNNITPIWRQAKPPKESVALPVFGIHRNDTGFLGIITEGEEDARINGIPAGIRNISLYRASAEFVYRKQDLIFIGNSGQIPLFQGEKIAGDRQIRYVLLEDKDADYVGMAKAYREYLVKEKGVKPVIQEEMPMSVHLLGGILRDEIIGSDFIKMTTFEQARAIIDEYAGKGINNLELTFTGWSEDGLYGDQPDHFPVDKHLGGSKGLKELVSYAKEKGISIYLQANYVRPFESSDGFSKRKDAIRGIDREVMESFNTYVSNGYNDNDETFYFLKPDRVFENHIKEELEDFAEMGIAGVSLKYMGDTIYSDLDPKSLTSRKQTADVWVNALDAFKEKVGKTAVDYGFAYTLGHVDRIDNVPQDSSHFVYTDQTVPFYQLVLHGLVSYTLKSSNLRDDSRMEFLRAVEYGALPSFELTFEPPSTLQRTMEDRLFSSSYSYWLDPSVEEYHQFAEIYKAIGNQQIVNHERINEQVYRTTYANGTQIIVNYGEEAMTIDGQTVKGLNYAMSGGGR